MDRYGIFTRNELLSATERSSSVLSQRTVRIGQIVKIDIIYTNGTLQVRCLLEEETWEPATFLVQDPNCVVFLPLKIWQYIASIASPQERVKLAKNKELCQKLTTLARDNIVGFVDNSDIRFGKIKYMGQVKGMGYCFGLELNEKKQNNKCNGLCAGIQYFKCEVGYGIFTTIERIHPISYTAINGGTAKQNNVTHDLGCDDLDATFTKPITQPSFLNGSFDPPPREEIVTKFGEYSKKLMPDKTYTYVRNSLSLHNISDTPSQTSVNPNNDFDQNTIIQPDKTYLITDKLKNKSEMQLCDLIGTSWSGATDLNELETFSNLSVSKNHVDITKNNLDKNDNYKYKSGLSMGIVTNGGLNNRKERNKSVNVISHLMDGTNNGTLKKSKFYTHSNYDEVNGMEIILKDTKISPRPKHKEERKKIGEEIKNYAHPVKPTSKFYVDEQEPIFTDPPPGSTNDLVIGTLVEVQNDVIEQQPLYGVVRWLGAEKDTHCVLVGIELEEDWSSFPLTLTDGVYNNERYFKCAPNRALFVPLDQCRKDSRFQDDRLATPVHQVSEAPEGFDCPAVPGAVAPLYMPSEEDVQAVCGKYRGIQGHHNSCYLDVTLFSMFTYTSVFDTLLFRPRNYNDIEGYDEVQRVLREEIVNPLRKNLFVSAERVMKLRKLLDRLSSVSGLTSEEKDPEEFLNSLLNQILKAEPFLKLSSGQEAFHYQLFVEKNDALSLPTVQQLFEQSILTSDIKLREVPSCLIIQMPRFGKSYKMYPRILPSQLLDVTDVIEGSPRQCTVCGQLARLECRECFNDPATNQMGLECTSFCPSCFETVHRHQRRKNHKPRELAVNPDFLIMEEHCRPPRLYMELFAVICIETSHYVAFVKCGVGHEAPWCFFDSMADRKGERNGYNIPEMVACPDIGKWLSDEGACRQLHEDFPADRHLPEHARRLLCDAYICMYQSQDVLMYR